MQNADAKTPTKEELVRAANAVDRMAQVSDRRHKQHVSASKSNNNNNVTTPISASGGSIVDNSNNNNNNSNNNNNGNNNNNNSNNGNNNNNNSNSNNNTIINNANTIINSNSNINNGNVMSPRGTAVPQSPSNAQKDRSPGVLNLKGLLSPRNRPSPRKATRRQGESRIESPASTKADPQSIVFGVPLEEIMARQRQSHPELQIPFVVHYLTTKVFELKGEKTEGIFR
jgi:hypothetical protein